MDPLERPDFPSLLAPGRHLLELAHVEELCVARFRDSRSRPAIMSGVRLIYDRLRKAGIDGELWIDGSFVTSKPDPVDVDMAVRFQAQQVDDGPKAMYEALKWVSSDLREPHRVDGYVWPEWPVDAPAYETGESQRQYWLRWFGTSRNGQAKGIVVVRLGAGMPWTR